MNKDYEFFYVIQSKIDHPRSKHWYSCGSSHYISLHTARVEKRKMVSWYLQDAVRGHRKLFRIARYKFDQIVKLKGEEQ
jgi:hypothetical protein